MKIMDFQYKTILSDSQRLATKFTLPQGLLYLTKRKLHLKSSPTMILAILVQQPDHDWFCLAVALTDSKDQCEVIN